MQTDTMTETEVEQPIIQEQPNAGESAVTDNSTPETPKVEPKTEPEVTVPMHRFKEVYGKMKNLERQIQEAGNPAKKTEPQTTLESSAPDWNKYQAEGKTAEEFNLDFVKYGTTVAIQNYEKEKQEKAAREREIEEQTNASLNFQKHAMIARTKYNDFDKVQQAANEIGISFPDKIALAIAKSDKAGDLWYHVLKNHEDAYKIMSISMTDPDKALIELGKIEAKLENGASGQPEKITKAKPPIDPLNGNGKGKGALKFADKPDMSLAEFNVLFPPDF